MDELSKRERRLMTAINRILAERGLEARKARHDGHICFVVWDINYGVYFGWLGYSLEDVDCFLLRLEREIRNK